MGGFCVSCSTSPSVDVAVGRKGLGQPGTPVSCSASSRVCDWCAPQSKHHSTAHRPNPHPEGQASTQNKHQCMTMSSHCH